MEDLLYVLVLLKLVNELKDFPGLVFREFGGGRADIFLFGGQRHEMAVFEPLLQLTIFEGGAIAILIASGFWCFTPRNSALASVLPSVGSTNSMVKSYSPFMSPSIR